MPRLVFAASLMLFSTLSHANQNWEICMDKADFSFSVDEFQGSKTATKSGCQMRLLVYGGKGEKLEINLCDPVIHIDRYDAIDSPKYTRLVAGTAGCPAPLFGADFDRNLPELQEFRSGRQRAFDIFETIKMSYGPDADKVNLGATKELSEKDSSAKVACGQYLLREYLQKCMAFEARKIDDAKSGPKDLKDTTPSNIPGVHPQTILVPTK